MRRDTRQDAITTKYFIDANTQSGVWRHNLLLKV